MAVTGTAGFTGFVPGDPIRLQAGDWRDATGDLGDYALTAAVRNVARGPGRMFDGDDSRWLELELIADPEVVAISPNHRPRIYARLSALPAAIAARSL